MRDRIYEFLDKNYPITGTEINTQFDRYPNLLLIDVFGTKTRYFDDWALSRTKSENYTVLYEHRGCKTWRNKELKIVKVINAFDVESITTYDDKGRYLSVISSNGHSKVWKYNEDNTHTLITTNGDSGNWNETFRDSNGNDSLIDYGNVNAVGNEETYI